MHFKVAYIQVVGPLLMTMLFVFCAMATAATIATDKSNGRGGDYDDQDQNETGGPWGSLVDDQVLDNNRLNSRSSSELQQTGGCFCDLSCCAHTKPRTAQLKIAPYSQAAATVRKRGNERVKHMDRHWNKRPNIIRPRGWQTIG